MKKEWHLNPGLSGQWGMSFHWDPLVNIHQLIGHQFFKNYKTIQNHHGTCLEDLLSAVGLM